MNTVILALVLTLIFVGLTIWLLNKDRYGFAGLTAGLATATAMILMVVLILALVAPSEINTFTKQKAYIESVNFDEFQSAGITLAKVEQNEWLYKVQFNRDRWGDWSPYPSSVLDLEPIK